MAIRSADAAFLADGSDGSLETSDQLFQTAFESAAIGMFLVKLDGFFLQANRSFCQMLGYTEDELQTRTFLEVTHPEDLESSRKCARALLSRECTRYWFSKRYVRQDGDVVWTDVSVCLLREANGTPRYFLTQAQDISEHLRAREHLKLERQNLRGIMAATPNPTYLVNQQLEIEYANPALSRELGPADKRKCYSYLFGRSERCPGCPCERVWGGETARLELASTVTGKVYDVIITPIKRRDGGVSGLCTLHDITERKRTEEALRANEARYRSLFESTGTATVVFGEDGVIVLCNSNFEVLTGYCKAEVEGKMRWSDFLLPEDLATLRSREAASRRGEEVPREYNTRCVHRAGHIRHVHASLAAAPGSRDRIVSLLDTTEHKIAERKLHESEERYRLLFSSSPVAISLSRGEETLYANEAYLRLFGHADATEVVGRSSLGEIAPQCRPEMAERTRLREEGGDVPQVYETTGLRADGSQFPLLVQATRFALPDGPAVLAFLDDVTERKMAEESQRLAAVGELAAGVAHDFNNLLTCMSGTAQMVATGHYDSRKLIEIVLDSTRQGSGITRDLMAFARPQEPRRELGRIEESVDAALAVSIRQIENAEVEVVREYAPQGRPLCFDPTQINQVFLNLILNACHAMPAGGALTVATRYPEAGPAAGHAIVTVTDTGVGIPPEHLPRIFEPFFTTKGKGGTSGLPGTGLGLSVSHGIVTAHGGAISVRSEVEAGTSFEIRLPAPVQATEAEAPAVAEPEAPCPDDECGLRGARILIADDREAIVMALTFAFTRRGCNCTGAGNARDAIAALRENTFDLVISDLMMSGGGGQAILEFARGMADPPPVVIITGRLERCLHDELLALGAIRTIEKPFDFATVVQTAGDLLAPPRR